jgi:ABC-type lipoprotein release transport system permease subunit
MVRSATDQQATEQQFISSVRFGLWLSWQELNGRKFIFFINLVLISLLISLAVAVDLMGKARKSSVQDRIDYMGPSLSLVPSGISSSDLVKAQLKGRTYTYEKYAYLRRDLSELLRASEARLIMHVSVGQSRLPAVGIDFQEVRSYPFSQFSLKDDEVLMGSLVARKFNKKKGDDLVIQAQTFTVADIIETAGGIDDLSLFMPLLVMQDLTGKKGLINEIRLFPGSSASLEELKRLLREQYSNIGVIDSYRGETAEEGINTKLEEYQIIVYAAAFILIALCIIISTYINLDSRRSEIATIYTLGATKGIIFLVFTLRTVWLALLGAVAGQVLALIITVLQDYQTGLQNIWAWKSFIVIVLGTIFLGLLVTTPFTVYSVFKRNLTSHL